MKTKIISEIGINHNGDLDLCKKMIMASKVAGCNYVKIQKRNPDVCVPENQKNKVKSTPWGEMTYLEYKHKIEFNVYIYKVKERNLVPTDKIVKQIALIHTFFLPPAIALA